MSEDLIGKSMGKYELRERIGRGGMAEVYKAYHATLDRFVALKILHPFLGEDPEFKERFSREARNVAQLRHPNIVQVYDFDTDEPRNLFYMIMEYVDGPTLRSYLREEDYEDGQVPTTEAIRITAALANALAYAHSHEMVHRDIKPGNIMLDSDKRIVLTDFGIARIVSGPQMTASGSMVGTPAYMSPEQGLGQTGDHRSDIYSLGVVLYQLVTGATPYDADTPIAVILKHVNDPLPPPSTLVPDIPRGLEMIIYKALAKSPDERYQDVQTMADHLLDLEYAATALVIPESSNVATPHHNPLYSGAASVASMPATEQTVSRRRSGCLGFIALLIVAFAAMFSGSYLAFTGTMSSAIPFLPDTEFVLTATPISTSTPIVLPTDVPASTSLPTSPVEIQDTPLPAILTPDLTATLLACDYDYEIISEDPERGSSYPELTTMTKRITIINDSNCAIDDDTRFVFSDGILLADSPPFIEFNQRIESGEQFTIELQFRTPALNPANPLIKSTWLVILPGGYQVGPPFVIEINIVPSSG